MNMKKIVIASKNEGKIKEIKNFLHGIESDFLTLNDFPNIPDIVEDGKSFEDNAMKKAKVVFEHTKLTTIADDSGLEVNYLSGEPGVHSARFAGDDANDQQNNDKLLELLKDVPMEERKARFKCVIVLYNSLYNNIVFAAAMLLMNLRENWGSDMTRCLFRITISNHLENWIL